MMADDYMPTTDEVRDAATLGALDAANSAGEELDVEAFRGMFDRYLAARDAEVRADERSVMQDHLPEVVAPKVRYYVSSRRAGKTQMVIESILAQANDRGIRLEIVEPRQTVTTAVELDALPVGSVIVDPFDAQGYAPVVACKDRWGMWGTLGGDPGRVWSSADVATAARMPLIVAYVPTVVWTPENGENRA